LFRRAVQNEQFWRTDASQMASFGPKWSFWGSQATTIGSCPHRRLHQLPADCIGPNHFQVGVDVIWGCPSWPRAQESGVGLALEWTQTVSRGLRRPAGPLWPQLAHSGPFCSSLSGPRRRGWITAERRSSLMWDLADVSSDLRRINRGISRSGSGTGGIGSRRRGRTTAESRSNLMWDLAE
jgi:hypothetical protein